MNDSRRYNRLISPIMIASLHKLLRFNDRERIGSVRAGLTRSATHGSNIGLLDYVCGWASIYARNPVLVHKATGYPWGRRTWHLLRSFRVAADRVTDRCVATHEAPVPLGEVFDVSTHQHRSLVGFLIRR